MPLAVNDQSEEILAIACEWPVLAALQGGTPAMRKASTAYLPRFPNEEPDSYAFRLATATLFPAYDRTVGVMSAKPFAEKLTLSEDTPESIQKWAEDIDLQGVSLHSFAAEMFKETLGYGLAGVLVEYPAAPPQGRLTVAQVEASGRRPYMVRVMHDQILGYKTETVNGRLRLTQLRLAESTKEDDGEYGTKTIPCVRVLRPGSWEVWKQTTDKNWVLDSSGTTSLPDIPFVPFYGVREGFMVGKAPLLNLAYLNVEHFQSKSDQQNLLRVARVPILCMVGAEDETALVVGASAAVKLPENADLKYVEHSGAAIGAGREALGDLVEEMVQCGAELLVKKPSGQRTASQDNNEAEGNKCDLQRVAENFADGLDHALKFMAAFASLPSGGEVSLFDDYGAADMSDAAGTLIKDLQMAGLISKRTALKELQRQGKLSPDLDVDDELEAAEADGPPLAASLELAKIGMAADKQNADDE